MKSNTQNAKIEAITEKTLVLGIDVGSETHYARAFDYRGIEYSKKPFKFSNTEVGFATFKEWILDLKERQRPRAIVLRLPLSGDYGTGHPAAASSSTAEMRSCSMLFACFMLSSLAFCLFFSSPEYLPDFILLRRES